LIRSEKPVWTNPTALVESARCEIRFIERHGISIGSRLARNLTQDHVFPMEDRQYQSWPLCLTEIGEWEVEDYNIAFTNRPRLNPPQA
jgi:hypothetical protein